MRRIQLFNYDPGANAMMIGIVYNFLFILNNCIMYLMMQCKHIISFKLVSLYHVYIINVMF